jgi:hypothetical protein
MPPLRVVALHEAGHAVVGEVGEVQCTSLTIAPDRQEGTEGCVEWSGLPDIVDMQMLESTFVPGDSEWDELKSFVDARIKSSLAGALTEQRITGHFNWEGSRHDFNQIGQLIGCVYAYEGPDYDEALCPVTLRDPQMGVELEYWSQVALRARELWDDEVEAILDEHWDWVEAVAYLAMWKKTITGDQVRAARPSTKTTMTLTEVREAQ